MSLTPQQLHTLIATRNPGGLDGAAANKRLIEILNAIVDSIGSIGDQVNSAGMSPISHPSYTVAGLPAAASWTYGVAFVTDATLTAITGLGLAPIGGGVNKVPVYSDGILWLMI